MVDFALTSVSLTRGLRHDSDMDSQRLGISLNQATTC
jgi:hypothetical protein